MPIAPRQALLSAMLTAGLIATPAMAWPATAAATAPAQETSTEDTEKISLLSFNDFHGALSEQYSGTLFADTVEDYRTAFEAANGEGSSLLTTAGDLIGASASVSNAQQDEPTIEIMNAIGLAASAAGNHEFDKSLKDLEERVLPLADYPVLAANFVDPQTKEPILPSHEVFTVDGVRVAVIGAVPHNLYATTTGAGLEGNEVTDLVESVNAVATELEANDEADVIVASYHDGANGNGDLATETADSEVFDRIVNETDESVDVIFNGHSHQTYNYDTTVRGTNRPVVQAGQSGNLLAAVELTLDCETKEVLGYTSQLIKRTPTPVTADQAFDQAAMDALVADSTDTVREVYGIERAAVEEFGELKNTVVGDIDAPITTDYRQRIEEDGAWRAGGTRREETTLGNWAADALKDRVSLSNPEVDLGVTNSGGLRSELLVDRLTAGGEFTPKPADLVGKVSLGEILDLAPFGNRLVYFDIPGSSIKQVLEENWQDGKKSQHLGWSTELTWTYDDSRAQDDKVTGIWINGTPVVMDRMYTVATLSFLGDTSWVGTGNPAPDGYEGFAQGQQNYVDLGIRDSQAFQEYVGAQTAATGGIRPDYSKNAVEVRGAPSSVAPGAAVTLTLDNLELASDGAGNATSVAVAFETGTGERIPWGTVAVPVEGETVALSGITVPQQAAGTGELVMTVSYDDQYASASEVRSPLTVTGAPALVPAPALAAAAR